MAREKTRTSDPTMGTSAATTVVNTSGARSKNTIPQASYGIPSGGMIDAATASHRPNIQEKLGSQLRITAKLYSANAASAGMSQRNVRILPPVMRSPFWDANQRASSGN